MRRYLTTEAKRRTLAEWRRVCSDPVPEGPQGGRGYPDPAIVPWCNALNEIPGVATLQSCAGHGPDDAGDPAVSGEPGHLWLWFSPAMSQAFDSHAFELAADPLIERVTRIYARWGQEVTCIAFAGNERGQLDASMRRVLDFLWSLQLERERAA